MQPHPLRAANHAGEQFGENRFLQGQLIADGEAGPLGHDAVLGEAAIQVHTQGGEVQTVVGHPPTAVATQAAGQVGGDHYSLSRLKRGHLLAYFHDAADVLVPQDHAWRGGMARRHLQDVHVSAANAGPLHLQEHLIGLGDLRYGDSFECQVPLSLEDSGEHGVWHV